MWSKLGIRLASASIGIIIVMLITFSPPLIFNVSVSIVCMIALHELYMTFKQEKKWQIVLLDYIAAVMLMLVPFITPNNYLTFILVAYLTLLLVCAILWNDKIKFYDVGTSVFMLIYTVLFLYHLTFLRNMENGLVLVFLAFIGAWMPDTFAYFTGKLCGKHKLIPSISPNKTVEGSIGAIAGCIAMYMVFGLIVENWVGLQVRYVPLVILAFLCGIFAQLGDLAASLVKRECNAKDFGNLIPGHGGILDRIDSLIFIAPLIYYYLNFVTVIY